MLEKLDYLAALLPEPVSSWVSATRRILSETFELEPRGDWLASVLKSVPMITAVLRPWLERLLRDPDELVALFERLEAPTLALLERTEAVEIDEEQVNRWLEWLSEQLVKTFEGSLQALDRDQLDTIIAEIERFIMYVAEQAAFGEVDRG